MQESKCGANLNKNREKSTNYASCTSSWQYFIGLLRSYLLGVQDQIEKFNVYVLLKNDSKECQTNSECRNVKNVEQAAVIIGLDD